MEDGSGRDEFGAHFCHDPTRIDVPCRCALAAAAPSTFQRCGSAGELDLMSQNVVLSTIDDRGVATVTLNRPEVHNAYDERLIDELAKVLHGLSEDRRVRVVVLRGNGKHFQAGADLNCLGRLASATPEQNFAFSLRTTEAMCRLNAFPRPTLALVQGACYGGGVGLVACCDVAVATASASFALTEVRWGVIPAPIVPQLCAAMGVRSLRRYAVSGERFTARAAERMGLIHEVCAEGGLDDAAAPIVDALLHSAPEAAAESKLLLLEQAGLQLSEQQVRALALQAAAKRASPEAAEGLRSFQEKRKPAWYPGG
jgi:methylglutaconyl-CoA hydratase